MKSRELIGQCENLTRRKLDYWCKQGIFHQPIDDERPRRDFSEEDLRVARVVARVAAAFDLWSGGRGAFMSLYREVAQQVRAGQPVARVPVGNGVEVIVQVDEQPAPAEVAFVPGIGVDNA